MRASIADVDPVLHDDPNTVRAQVRQSRPMNMTVNDLASNIFGHEESATPQGDFAWLSRLRNAEGIREGLESQHSPSLVRPSIWISDLLRTQPDTIRPSYLYGDNITIPDPGFSASETRNVLDGTSLAIATGLPLRYGPEIVQCVDLYFARLHHVLPVVHEDSFRRLLSCPPQLTTFQRSFFLALCAVAKLKSSYIADGSQNQVSKEVGCLFLERSLQLRSSINFMEEQSPSMVVAAYLLHLAHACLNKSRTARFFLQEAICQALDLGLHFRDDPLTHDDIEKVCVQRTLALLFVTERATVILNDCAAILLRDPPCVPTIYFNEDDRNILRSFQCLFSLFALLDVDIVEYWCSRRLKDQGQKQSLNEKLGSVQNRLSTMSFHNVPFDDFQKADVLVTQQWLRLVCWQISMRIGFLSSQSSIPAFSYEYPIEIGSDLCAVLESLPDTALRVHHFSIVSDILFL